VAGSVLLPLVSLGWKVETESESLKLLGVSKNVLAGTFISISACGRRDVCIVDLIIISK